MTGGSIGRLLTPAVRPVEFGRASPLPPRQSARVMHRRCPSEKEGAGSAGCYSAPAASRANVRSTRVVEPQVCRNIPALPARWVDDLLRVLPGEPGFLATVACRPTADLTPASGCQDDTASPYSSGAFVCYAACVHRIPLSTFVTTRTPLLRGRDGGTLKCFGVVRQARPSAAK